MVLLFHAGLGFSGGYVGVDVFFVISGFLITGLILKEQDNGTFRLADFWARRIRRILPAAVLMVAAVLLAGFALLLPADYESLGKSAITQQLMLSNVYFWRNTGYFSGPAELMPLLHTWSLAVEEQFYVGYPFLLIILARLTRKTRMWCLLVLATVSLAASQYGVLHHTSAAFFLLPARAWELLVGGLICFAPAPTRIPPRVLAALSWLSAAAILFAGLLFDAKTRFPGVSALLPCGGAAILIYANACHMTFPASILAAKPVVTVGRMSYSLYLWHWPLFAFSRYVFGPKLGLPVVLSLLAACFALAFLSWRFVEIPLRLSSSTRSGKLVVPALCCSMPVLLCTSLFIVSEAGIPSRLPEAVLVYDAASRSAQRDVTEVVTKNVVQDELSIFGALDGKNKCLVWGDSHAMHFIPGIEAACKSKGWQGCQATHSSTAPLVDFVQMTRYGLNEEAPEFSRAVLDYAQRNGVDMVVLAAFWQGYAANADSFESQLVKTLDELTKSGVTVVVVLDVALLPKSPKRQGVEMLLRMRDARYGVPDDVRRSEQQVCNSIISRCAEGKALVLDPSPYFVDQEGFWRGEIDGQVLYHDEGHLSVNGALRLIPMFEEMLDRVVSSSR